MKFIFKLIILILFFFYSLLYFFPKELAYNLLENELVKHKVIVSDETRVEKAFGLDIENAKVYFDGLQVANVNSISLNSFYFDSSFEVLNVKLLDSLSKMFPSKVSSINIKHNVLTFDKVLIRAKGDFGDLEGYFDILNRTLFIELKASRLMKNSYSKILRKMKNKKGVYTYEYKL